MNIFKTAHTSQNGMIPPVALILLLVVGLIVGVVVVQQRQTLQSNASQDQVQFIGSRVEGDRKIIDSPQVEIQLNAPWPTAEVSTPPANQPVLLSATCMSGNQVRINWEQVNEATSYRLKVDNATKGGWNGDCNNPNTPHDFCRDVDSNRHIFGYEPGDRYQLWVHAVNSRGESPASEQLRFSCPSGNGGGGGSGSGSNGMLSMVLGAASKLIAQDYPGQLPQSGPLVGPDWNRNTRITDEDETPSNPGSGSGGYYPGQLSEDSTDPNAEARGDDSTAYPGQLPQGDSDPNAGARGDDSGPYPGALPDNPNDPNAEVRGDGGVVGAVVGAVNDACYAVGLCGSTSSQPSTNNSGTSAPYSNNPDSSSGRSSGNGNSGGGGSSQPSVKTTGYRIAEDPAVLQSTPFRPYGRNGMKIIFNFANQTNGIKTIFVQFQNSSGGVSEPRAYIVELRTSGQIQEAPAASRESGGSSTTNNPAPATAVSHPTASINGPATGTVSQQAQYIVTVNSNAGISATKVWVAKAGNSGPVRVTANDIASFNGQFFNCNNIASGNCNWYLLNSSYGSPVSGTFTPTAAGTYKIIAEVTDNQNRICSSNPYVTYNPTYVTGGVTFYRCGDPATLVVNP